MMDAVKFDIDFLVHIRKLPSGAGYIGSCPSLIREAGFASGIVGTSRPRIVTQMERDLRGFMETDGIEHFKALASSGSEVRCPRGTINLVADRWFCKDTKKDCPIWAILDSSNLSGSLAKCNAPEPVKKGVLGAFEAGYIGLHHASGTYFCRQCKARRAAKADGGYVSQSLKQRFELSMPSDFFDVQDEKQERKMRVKMIRDGVHYSFAHGLCAPCMVEMAKALVPNLARQLKIYHFEAKHYTHNNSWKVS